MTAARRGRSCGAALLVASAVLVGGCANASVRDSVASHYAFVGQERGQDGTSLVYRSNKPPTRTAADISGLVSPGERRVTESGVFLRYSSDYVGVVPGRDGGSKIYVDDERRGYAHFYPFIGGYWGSYSGRGESFRGGGPGAGK